MATYYASVCKNTVRQNIRKPRDKQKPPIRVSLGKYGKPFYRWRMHIPAYSTLVCEPESPLPWGARVWLQWEA